MDEDRAAQLEKLGMISSHFDVAREEGLTAARGPPPARLPRTGTFWHRWTPRSRVRRWVFG
ncbi:hypothetical protein [Streptomyces sp. NBC_00887]|uniref:hypothetical protein n=1 Tax=Streptomyces sp. NBC_00887 TaxID=2975859 RepID=UPI0038642C16|nr:hypothetical protein OG844_01680 [Streptomyces sp. NBC_00887]WSY36139.1 hypothetical protein OG844_43920 [Streptomyces sp. NBC_00887]